MNSLEKICIFGGENKFVGNFILVEWNTRLCRHLSFQAQTCIQDIFLWVGISFVSRLVRCLSAHWRYTNGRPSLLATGGHFFFHPTNKIHFHSFRRIPLFPRLQTLFEIVTCTPGSDSFFIDSNSFWLIHSVLKCTSFLHTTWFNLKFTNLFSSLS